MKPLLMLILLAASVSMQAAVPVELRLWRVVPGRMLPPSKATEDFIRTKAGKGTLTNIHEPTLTIHRPEKPNGTSVVVVPGGGYAFLSAVHEGTQVCEWLNSLGVTAILLKYRTPTRDDAAPHDKPVQDALRAIAMVRNEKAWKLDPKRVGLMGFGAGGNLLAHVACDRAWQNQRPDFGIMIYGGAPEDTEPPRLNESFSVPADAPPVFMACAHGNEETFIVLTALHMAHTRQRIPAQLHLFTKGGQDFRMRKEGGPVNVWPQRCVQWMDDMGWLPSVGKVDDKIAKLRERLKELQPALNQTFCGNDGRELVVKKLEIAKPELLKAELANDKAKAGEFKTQIAECERFLKLIEDSRRVVRQIHEEAENATKAIQKLELERARILQVLADSQWP